MFQGSETAALFSTNWRGYRIAAWIGQFCLAIAVVILATRGNWQGVLTLSGFLIASFVFVLIDRRLPTFILSAGSLR